MPKLNAEFNLYAQYTYISAPIFLPLVERLILTSILPSFISDFYFLKIVHTELVFSTYSFQPILFKHDLLMSPSFNSTSLLLLFCILLFSTITSYHSYIYEAACLLHTLHVFGDVLAYKWIEFSVPKQNQIWTSFRRRSKRELQGVTTSEKICCLKQKGYYNQKVSSIHFWNQINNHKPCVLFLFHTFAFLLHQEYINQSKSRWSNGY